MYFLFNFSSTEDGVWHWWSVCRDLVSVASWPHAAPREPLGQADGTSCWRVCSSGLTAVVYYSRGSPGIQPMANIKAVPGILEQQECGWRSSPMNSASYMGQMPSARCMHAHYQFIQPLNTPCFSSNSLFFFSLKGALSFFFLFWAWISTIQTSAQWQATSPTLEKGPMCLKHLGRSIFLISSSAVNSADQKVDQRLPGDRHLCLPPAEDRERN